MVGVGSIVARFDYDAAADDEVSVRVGEIGQVLNKPSDDWWLVKFGDKNGLVPSNYVSEVLSEAIAEFDYSAQDDTEVNFNENDTILVLEKLDADWWVGQVNNMQGMFPSAYVKEVPPKRTAATANAPAHKKNQSGGPVNPQGAHAVQPHPPGGSQPHPPSANAPVGSTVSSAPSNPKIQITQTTATVPEAGEQAPVVSSAPRNAQPLLGLAMIAQSAQHVVLKKSGNKDKDKEKDKEKEKEKEKEKKEEAKQAYLPPAVPQYEPPASRMSVAEKLTSMKIERMEMLSKEVQMVSELEKELSLIKEQLKSKEQQLNTLQAKSDKEYKELTGKLEASETQRKEIQRKNGDLELEVGKLNREIATMKANDESGKVKELQETVRSQYEDLKKLQKQVEEKEDIIRETASGHEKILRTLNDQLDDLQQRLIESENKAKSMQTNAAKLDGIFAFGELVLQINGTPVIFKVTQSSSVALAHQGELPREELQELNWTEETKGDWNAKAEIPAPDDISPTPPRTDSIPKPVPEIRVSISKPPAAGGKPKFAPKAVAAAPAAKPVSRSSDAAIAPAAKPTSDAVAAPAAKPAVPASDPVAVLASKPTIAASDVPISALGAAPPKTRKTSYADKLKKGITPENHDVPVASTPTPAGDGKACELCAVGECTKFSPNQFKPHLCQTCRHNKNVHHL